MTQYHGGKQRIGKAISKRKYDIATEIEKETGVQYKGYCEPFCGMCGVYQHIPWLFQDHKPKMKYKAGDINKSVIMMWQEAQKGWVPPVECDQNKFNRLRGDGQSSAEKGFLGHACTFRGIYYITFDNRTNLKYSSDKVCKLSKQMEIVEFKTNSYDKYSRLKNYILYCDPPYTTSSRYYDEHKQLIKFSHDQFYTWVDRMSKHNLVFISERTDLPYELVGEYNAGEKLYAVTQNSPSLSQ